MQRIVAYQRGWELLAWQQQQWNGWLASTPGGGFVGVCVCVCVTTCVDLDSDKAINSPHSQWHGSQMLYGQKGERRIELLYHSRGKSKLHIFFCSHITPLDFQFVGLLQETNACMSWLIDLCIHIWTKPRAYDHFSSSVMLHNAVNMLKWAC